MIHYHSADISGKMDEVGRFLKGRHAMVSFASQDKLPIVMEVCQSFALDNGAFSIWKARKGQVDFDAYYAWCKGLAKHPGFDWALIPDMIDEAEQENIELVSRWIRVGASFQGVPIWHLHESLDWLDYLVGNFQRIALGSSGQWPTPGTQGWWSRMQEAMKIICDAQGRPHCKLHGLRMLNQEIFTRLPLSSADSANAGINAGIISRFGIYPHPSAAARAAIIADRIEAHNSAAYWQENTQTDILVNILDKQQHEHHRHNEVKT